MTVAGVGDGVRLMLLTTDDPSVPGGGREMLSRLNRSVLQELCGGHFAEFRLPAGARTRPLDGLRGRLNGLDGRALAELTARVAREDITHLVVDGSNLGAAVRAVKRACSQVRVLTFCHNVEARFFAAAFRARPGIKAALVWAGNRRAEAMAARWSDLLIAISPRDSAQFAWDYGRAADAIAPMAMADACDPLAKPAGGGEPYLLFVGGGFFGNVQGLAWYAREIAPHLPLRTCAIGRGLEGQAERLGTGSKVELIGAVDDLSPWYAGAALVVAPIRDGSGMKTKVAEALMHGKTVAGTPEAFAGYGEAVRAANPCAEDAASFVEAVKQVLERRPPPFDPVQRALYERYHARAAALARWSAILGSGPDRRRVVHLIPYHGIGGVETAAATMSGVEPEDFTFRVETLFPAPPPPLPLQPFTALATLVRLWRRPPDVLIVSLWRACAVGWMLKLLRPQVRLVLFLHSGADFHAADRQFNRAAGRRAERIWADCQATLAARMPALAEGKGRVISFLTTRIVPLPAAPPRPHFVFWGRLHAVKRFDRALGIFAGVRQRHADARLTVIGPDGGALAAARAAARGLGIEAAVQFTGACSFAEIRRHAGGASFFLQTSDFEGMATSVVEAMQLGLVPVVTPVGEIARYARDADNAVVVRDDAAAIAEICALIGDPLRYAAMRTRAIAEWQDVPLYSDSVIEACRELL
ncbi:MAG: glycosyltransferase [Sphingomonadales bacterium]|nr:glycosyltransferase [Sphingomonadales bacterium]